MGGPVPNPVNLVKKVVTKTVDLAGDVIGDTAGAAKDVVKGVANVGKETVQGAVSAAKDLAVGTVNTIKDVARVPIDLAKDVVNVTKDVVGGVADVIIPNPKVPDLPGVIQESADKSDVVYRSNQALIERDRADRLRRRRGRAATQLVQPSIATVPAGSVATKSLLGQ